GDVRRPAPPDVVGRGPGLTPVLSCSPRATVCLWLSAILPALTFVLIFILMVSFLENLIAAALAALLVKLLNCAGYYCRIFFRSWNSCWRGVGDSGPLHCHANGAGFPPGLFLSAHL